MKYYTTQENYKNNLLISNNSMQDFEHIVGLEKNIQRRIQMYFENDFKVVRNGNDIIFVSHNPNYDFHILKYNEYEE